MAHLLTDNAHGLVVEAEIASCSGTAEREVAQAMLPVSYTHLTLPTKRIV